jgi:fibronectin type III domain protein
MKTRSATAVLCGVAVFLLLSLPVMPGAHAQSTAAVEVVWEATRADFGGQMMDIDRFDNVYSVGDNLLGGTVLIRKFSPDGFLLWERSFQADFAVQANWVAADSNGGAYVVGNKWTGSDQVPIGYFVLRYDADGTLVWSDVSDGSAAQAVRAVADRAGNAYVSGGLYVDGVFSIGIIKYSAAGRQWVCPVENPNGTGFPGTPLPTGLYVSDNGSWIAASGTSGYNFYVLSCDDSGFKLWQDFQDLSVYAAGVAVNDLGEVYFGNGLAGGGGMQLSKYSATGVAQWTNVYSPGDYIHRLALDSVGNVIAIGPDYSNGWYADWVTMKVAPDGVRLWSRLFDALNGNNEIPGYVAVDPFDNVYVTGTGGPVVIAANGSQYLRMVTLKYSASGEPVWMIGSVDGFRGNVARVGQDGSTLFVQGYGQMYTARYLQTGLSAAPAAPTDLTATGVFDGVSYAANLSWSDNATNEFWYDIYRCSGAGCTGYVKIARTGENDTSYVDSAVVEGVTYSYFVVAHAFTGDSAGSNSAQATMGTAAAPAPTTDAAPAPTSLVAAALSSSQIVLQWTNSPSIQSAISIERCSGRCRSYTELVSVAGSATSFTDSGLAPHTGYSYRVRAYTAAGWSSYSATVTAKTLR